MKRKMLPDKSVTENEEKETAKKNPISVKAYSKTGNMKALQRVQLLSNLCPGHRHKQ
jgi:hypothetical protein